MSIYIPPSNATSGVTQQQMQQFVTTELKGYLSLTGGLVAPNFSVGTGSFPYQFNVLTNGVTATMYNTLDDSNANAEFRGNMMIDNLATNSIVQTDGNSVLTASNVLPNNLAATGMTLTTTSFTGTIVYNTNNNTWAADGTNTFSMPPITRYYYVWNYSGTIAANTTIYCNCPTGKDGSTITNVDASIRSSAGGILIPSKSPFFNSGHNYFDIAINGPYINISTGSSWVAGTSTTFIIWLDTV